MRGHGFTTSTAIALFFYVCVAFGLHALAVPRTLAQSGQAAPKESEAARNARQVVELTNAERRKAGLPALKEQPQLAAAAMKHAEDMARNSYFDHKDREGGMPWDRVRAEGYRYRACAENIAKGARTPRQAVALWMKSPGHRKNILGDFAEIGVVFAGGGKKGETRYWVQVFGTPRE